MDTLNRWFARDKERADFRVVYINEAHPTDGRQVRANERAGVLIANHKALKERKDAAKQLHDVLGLQLPIFVDMMDDAASMAYAAWPDRLYVIGIDGTVVYAGAKGPQGFNAQAAMDALGRLR